jgi:DNA excision repair protein ERCC-3
MLRMTVETNIKNPLIVQGDGTLLLEVENESYQECRDWLSRFAELVKSPEHVHTYKVTSLAVWNAAASGIRFDDVFNVLKKFTKYEIPQNVLADIRDWFGRYGKLKLEKLAEDHMEWRRSDSQKAAPIPSSSSSQWLILSSEDGLLITEICNTKSVSGYISRRLGKNVLLVDPSNRGRLKQALIKIGFPIEDLVGYLPGEPLEIWLREKVLSNGSEFRLRPYQKESADAFYKEGSERGGSGVIVLPCGAGKTVVGIELMSRIREETLIIGSSTVGVRQWISELVDKTHLPREMLGEYTGDVKQVKPVTVTTYQCLTFNSRGDHNGDVETRSVMEEDSSQNNYPHFEIFKAKNWGLIIYDEVHLLPAPVFRMTADLQAKRRLGLTATLVREDGKEDDVFSLIGPKRFDSPWKELEAQGWIASAVCFEIRIPFSDYGNRMKYATSPQRSKYRIAAENPRKFDFVKQLIQEHKGKDCILVIGDYISQLERIRDFTNAPMISGKTPNQERERLYSKFRSGEIKLLVVSKVANYAIDLPDANVAIQVSGTFGSRQEEAQRLGRLLRPKAQKQSYFYTIVTKDTVDQEYASRRQLFLTERGYKYNIVDSEEIIPR